MKTEFGLVLAYLQVNIIVLSKKIKQVNIIVITTINRRVPKISYNYRI